MQKPHALSYGHEKTCEAGDPGFRPLLMLWPLLHLSLLGLGASEEVEYADEVRAVTLTTR